MKRIVLLLFALLLCLAACSAAVGYADEPATSEPDYNLVWEFPFPEPQGSYFETRGNFIEYYGVDSSGFRRWRNALEQDGWQPIFHQGEEYSLNYWTYIKDNDHLFVSEWTYLEVTEDTPYMEISFTPNRDDIIRLGALNREQARPIIQAWLDHHYESLDPKEQVEWGKEMVVTLNEQYLPGVFEATGLQLFDVNMVGGRLHGGTFILHGDSPAGYMGWAHPTNYRIVNFDGQPALAYYYITHTGVGWHGLRVWQVVDGQVAIVHHESQIGSVDVIIHDWWLEAEDIFMH